MDEPDETASGPRKTRHGRHRRDSRPITMWLPIENIARLRRCAKDLKMTVTALIVRAIGPLDTIVLSEEDVKWIDEQMRKAGGREY